MTNPPNITTIGKLATADDVYRVLDFVRSASDSRRADWTTLDFTSVGENSKLRYEPQWTQILSNELLGEFAETKLEIYPPQNPTGRKILDRCGMSFALKQRMPQLTMIKGTFDPEWPAPNWARVWSPRDSEYPQRLFHEPLEPDMLFNREFAIFINPHLASYSDLKSELAQKQTMGWLRELILHKSSHTTRQSETSTEQAFHLTTELHRICYQLITNLRHAFTPLASPSPNVPYRRLRSYVHLYNTKGGGSGSHNRLHITVADLGHGILRTLRPKLEAHSQSGSNRDSLDIIRALLSGTLRVPGRDAGKGYRAIVYLLHKYKSARLYLTTGYRTASEFEVVRAKLTAQDDPHITYDPNIRFFGTTVHIVIPYNKTI